MKIHFLKASGTVLAVGVVVSGGFAAAAPQGWEVTEFAGPPQVEYPTAISASARGDVYVSVDPNGSLGRNPDFGKIVRARDTDGDGKADDFQDFVPHVTSARGGHYVGETFYLIHPPYLSAYRDNDGDGVAEENKVLVKGFGGGVENPRGADHTTNGVRMGIDGWLYVAVGDFGMAAAKGADGTEYTLWGGGVVRVRPDGSELEPYALYTRNICDVAITPTLDMFARDNTNDGKGWNTRFHHFVPLGDSGYPRLYKNFPEETILPLKDYGGGSGTGALALNEPGFPKVYNNAVFTCDWTTGNVYRHPMTPMGATFKVDQEVFHKLPRAVDIDVDGSSRLYIADWRNGRFNYDKDAKVGMIHQMLPPDWKEREFPDLKKMSDQELVVEIGSESATMRLEAQREMITRGVKPVFGETLTGMAKDPAVHLFNRVAAIFTFKQLYGAQANAALAEMTEDQVIREFALRALADRKTEMKGLDAALFEKFLGDENPRVVVQAINGLVRMDSKSSARAILQSLAGKDISPGEMNSDVRRVVPHVAIQALIKLGAGRVSLEALDDAAVRSAALRVLRDQHTVAVVEGLMKRIENPGDEEKMVEELGVLARLFYKEDKWDLVDWWGTRPDDRGPYYAPVEWEKTSDIKSFIERMFPKVPEISRSSFITTLGSNRIPVSSLKLEGLDPVVLALAEQGPDEAALTLLSGAAADESRDWKQRTEAYRVMARAEPELAVGAQIRTLATWTTQDIPQGKSMVADFVNDTDRRKDTEILEVIAKEGSDEESTIAWKAMLTLLQSPLIKEGAKGRIRENLDKNPMEVGLFHAISEMKLSGFEKQIAAGIGSDNEKTIQAAERARDAGSSGKPEGGKIGEMPVKEAEKLALGQKGDAENGERLFVSQGCMACHAIDPEAVQKGPYLGSAGAKFQKDYLIQSILEPNAVVAQGFQTTMFTTNGGKAVMGFVTKEEDGVIEVRDIAGQITNLNRADVKDEQQLPQSMMPPGLADTLTTGEFSDLIEYLESLKSIGG